MGRGRGGEAFSGPAFSRPTVFSVRRFRVLHFQRPSGGKPASQRVGPRQRISRGRSVSRREVAAMDRRSRGAGVFPVTAGVATACGSGAGAAATATPARTQWTQRQTTKATTSSRTVVAV